MKAKNMHDLSEKQYETFPENTHSLNESHSSDEDRHQEFNMKQFLIMNCLFWVIYAVVIGTDFVYKDALFDKDIETVPDIQDKDSFMDHFMFILGYAGESEGITLTNLIAISIFPYIDGLFYTLVVLSSAYMNGVLKLLHHDPRPFYAEGDVEALMWDKSYGNPSGHSMYFTTVIPMFFYLIYHSKFTPFYQRTNKFWIVYCIVCFWFITVSILGLFGRIYLGVHSYDQVLYGMLFGWTMFWHILIVFRPLYLTIAKRFINKNCTKKEWIDGCIITLWVMAGLMAVALIAYAINILSFDNPQSWTDNILQKCEISHVSNNSKFARKGLRNLFLPIGIVGWVLGTILYSYFTTDCTNRQSFDKWWHLPCRLLINLAIPLPFGLLMLIPSDTSFVVVLLFGEFLVGFAFSFLSFSLSKYANRCVNNSE